MAICPLVRNFFLPSFFFNFIYFKNVLLVWKEGRLFEIQHDHRDELLIMEMIQVLINTFGYLCLWIEDFALPQFDLFNYQLVEPPALCIYF